MPNTRKVKKLGRGLPDEPVVAGLIAGVSFWFVESAVHSYLSNSGTFFDQAFHPDAHDVWVRLLVAAILVGFSLYASSLIKRLCRAESEAFTNNERLGAMLSSMTDHISVLDRDLNIIWANRTALENFGEDIIGRKCFEAYHRREQPCEPTPCLTLKAFADGEVHEHETEVIDRSGAKRYYHCTANVAMRDSRGRPVAVIEISRDITERREAEDALSERVDELERFRRATVERELRMKELREKIAWLERQKEGRAGGHADFQKEA